ncbi:MAG: ribosome recycling factor [Rickettsiales bacterium]|jgi:ribosome recycling factor|nr:ribosome recycling factor [Rickettsiales bacterium]
MSYSSFSEIKQESESKMAKAMDVLKKDLAGLRTGRASIGLLDNIMVLAYGQPTPINQVASLSTPDARTISVSVWDKGNTAAVEKAIRESDLGLNPASDGTLIRIPLPSLTEERRKELVKVAGGYAENAKQSVRHVRHSAIEGVEQLKKDKLISEDEERADKDEVQKLTDRYTAAIDEHFKAKQADIMSIS